MSEVEITWADIIREVDSLGTIEERAELLGRRCREALSITYCSYCGQQEHAAGLTEEQQKAAMLEHILTCPKRPEMKLLNVALAAAEYVETHSDESYATLVVELDRLKVKPNTR